MKRLPLLITLFLTTTSIAQTDTTYLNSASEKCSPAEATSYRIVKKQESDYLVKNIDMKTNLPRSIFICSGINPIVKNGFCVNYYASGSKKSKGYCEDNKAKDKWIIWDEDGKDSSIINYTKDGEYKFIRVSPNLPYYNGDSISELCETQPSFPGGQSAMMQFLRNSVVYPQKEKEAGISGTCYITFVIERDGSLSDVRVLRGVRNGEGFDAEALRIINSMPKWSPGKLNGKNVRIRFNIPIKFNLH